MVAAAVFIALGVADRLREQRLALTEAERRAQIDPLTGVLNRRSIVERLDAACSGVMDGSNETSKPLWPGPDFESRRRIVKS